MYLKKSYIVILYIYVCVLELIKEKLGHVTTIIVVVALYVQLKLEQAVSIYWNYPIGNLRGEPFTKE
jgi:hypothetical protein